MKTDLPRHIVKIGSLDESYDFAEKAFGDSPSVFNLGGLLVLLNDDATTTPVGVARCMVELSRFATWWITKTNAKGESSIEHSNPPRSVAEALVASNQWKNVRPLKGILHHPILTSAGKLLLPGYDAVSQLYCHYNPEDFPQIPETPDKNDVDQSLKVLMGLVSTFDLEEDYDRAAVICFMLLAVCRASLSLAPLGLISAPIAGSGKGMLARILCFICAPQEPPAATLGANVEECKKEIISRLLSGAPVLYFDELAADEIDSIDLRTLATSETLGGRFLGQSRALNLPTRVLCLLTGNNAIPSADSARRIVEIRLNPGCETPSLREFEFDPIDEIKKHRPKYISAILTIQRAFVLAGSPKPDAPATGSFGDWDRWCRWPVMWLMNVDPATRMHRAIQADPKKGLVVRVFRGWFDSFESEAVRVSAIVQGANAPLREVLDELFCRRGEISAAVMGRWLAKQKDRVAGGLVLRDAGLLDGNRRWRIDVVAPLKNAPESGEVVSSGELLIHLRNENDNNQLNGYRPEPLKTTSPLHIEVPGSRSKKNEPESTPFLHFPSAPAQVNCQGAINA